MGSGKTTTLRRLERDEGILANSRTDARGSGSFLELKTTAEAEGLSLNALCLRRLRAAAGRPEGAQLSLLPEVEPALDRLVDPVQATFRGGRTEPLHDWYPHLEGYSPEFVEKVLDSFAPEAARVLDPFAGAGTTPLDAASIAAAATTAALVPGSNLVRCGDLRFRKGRERGGVIPDLSGEVSRRLGAMARDVVRLRSAPRAPLLVVADARRLGRLADLRVDAAITSPPYLNGANYYRNTKIELWFLRALRSGGDLTAFRRQTITAGINDVTAGKSSPPISEDVEAVVRTLWERACDLCIPQMVLNYFADMQQVFDSLIRHAAPSSPLVIDIGDSAYAEFRVDTPAILADLLRSRGWTFRRVPAGIVLGSGGSETSERAPESRVSPCCAVRFGRVGRVRADKMGFGRWAVLPAPASPDRCRPRRANLDS